MVKEKHYKHLIDRDWCKGCGICTAFCPQEVLDLDDQDKVVVVRPQACVGCRLCELRCPDLAIEISTQDQQER